MGNCDTPPSGACFDYIVVGGGTAGCVLASRLSEMPDARVLLIEAGKAATDLLVRVPAATALNLRVKSRVWEYNSEPQRGLGGRTAYHPRGRLLGGTCAISGMLFVRGHPRDFDGWAAAGASGWDYRSVLPYFRRLEDYRGAASAYRGVGGPVWVERPASVNPLSEAFLAAGPDVGLPMTADQNAAEQHGVAIHDMMIRRGVRETTATAYLAPARERRNLTIATEARALRLVFTGVRATGISVETRDGVRTWHAEREIILSGGAIGSPHLLMLSGVGPSASLLTHGIKVVVDLPGVGANLQDHIAVDVAYRSKVPVSLAREARPHRLIRSAVRWMISRDGVAARSPFEVGAFIESPDSDGYPDLQCIFIPITKDRLKPRLSIEGFTLSTGVGCIRSRGRLALESADPRKPPRIDPQYLADAIDRRRIVHAVSFARELAAQKAFDQFRGAELSPGAAITANTDVEQFVARQAFGCYHLTGTCRMGTDDDAVVDSLGRVHGTHGLRVCDAAIMPSVPNGNLNAPIIMLAERMADLILGADALDPVPVITAQAGGADSRGAMRR